MSIKKSTGLEETSLQQHCHHLETDLCPQQDNQAQPMSQQQEQQHLQQYLHENSNNGESWTQHDEEKILQSWASRTFSATCYKFTIQNDPATRQQTSGPLYSFLENWQLHSMYNKSQKILLGIADRRPCVLLTGDDFMFTPPPLKDAPKMTTTNSQYQQAHMDYLDDEDDEMEDDMDEEGGTSGGSGGGMDEHLWMLYPPTVSPLHVVNVSSTDEDDNDDDLPTSEQETMVMGHDQINTRAATTSGPPAQRQRLVSPALVKWYQTVEHPTTIVQQQRRPSTIMMAPTHEDNDQQISPTDDDDDDDETTTTEIRSISHEDTPTLTLIADHDNDNHTISSSTITTATDNTNNVSTTPTLVVVLTWRQWLQQGVMFISQRMVEVAYLVAEMAESFATTEQTAPAHHHHHLLMTHTYQEGLLKDTSAADYDADTDISNKATSRHYIVQLFRVWRVFFLGVETMMHRLFSSLDSSSSSHSSIAVLPLVTKSSSTF